MLVNQGYAAYANNKIATASPAELTLMLYEGAIKFCNIAIVGVEEKSIQKTHDNIMKTERIIEELQSTLDHKYPVAKDFDEVYSYLLRRLRQANIKKDKDIDLIYCHDSNMAMGAYEMLKKKGLEKQIHVIGIGSEQIYIDAVRDGKLYGIVTQSPEFEASFAWSCAKRAAEGFTLRFWYKTPTSIMTKENVDQKS